MGLRPDSREREGRLRSSAAVKSGETLQQGQKGGTQRTQRRGVAYHRWRSMNKRAETPPPPPESVHRIGRARLVHDRIERLIELVEGHRVIHIGFVDKGRMTARLEHGDWLHERLAGSARHLVGLDLDEEGVRIAVDLGYEAHVVDCESVASVKALGLAPAEIVLAGELIEHLSCPGAFLEAAKVLVAPGGTLVITTPNPSALTNVLAGLLNLELVNREHVGWHSRRTLQALLEQHAWTFEVAEYYTLAAIAVDPDLSPAHRVRVRVFNAYQRTSRVFFRLRPALADGLIVLARHDAA
jgi:2-polyprenyl-3-methyl-5-hydroxy-6-metoxy-1,4-benzoquinol methylase